MLTLVRRIFLLLALTAWVTSALAQAQQEVVPEQQKHAIERGEDGWFWYKDPKLAPKQKPAQVASAPEEPASAPKHPALVKMEALQKELNDSIQIAIMEPTEENMKHFLAVWYEVRKKSSDFADIGRTIAWANPQFSATLNGGRPTSPIATRIHDQERASLADQRIRWLAQTHGIFFVFRSDCKYCHEFAPILREFQQKYGFKVLPISLDGVGLPEYPDARPDNGMVARVIKDMKIPPGEFRTPFTALVRPAMRELMPIGFGLMSGTELVERIDKVVEIRDAQVAKK